MKICLNCKETILNKKWGFINLCKYCDEQEKTNKSMGIIIADGKTDYYFQIIKNPSKEQIAMIKATGYAHDPRTQLKAINKVSS